MARQKKNVDEIEIGDLVKHQKWGEGTVLSKIGHDDNTKVVVVFPEAGQKKLLVKYAKLKKVQLKKANDEDDEFFNDEIKDDMYEDTPETPDEVDGEVFDDDTEDDSEELQIEGEMENEEVE